MCGISGVLAFGNSSFFVEQDYLQRMNDALRHRGPDGQGVWISDNKKVGFAHRRLSIIDLSEAAAQPMVSVSGKYVITFNGEIYNHQEVRDEISAADSRAWKTSHSDTEVVLRAFELWGIECIERLRGMFAFAIWDMDEETLWLVRDRIGVKPLYYTAQNGKLAFASEIKAILCDRSIQRNIDEEALYNYLSFLTVPAPKTMFEGIYKLEPGTWIRAKLNGNLTKQRYWDALNNVSAHSSDSETEISERLLDTLDESVRYRMVGDVPVGVFLSGGIDSSTNAALFSKYSKNVKTFSIGYDEDYGSYSNEFQYAKRVSTFIESDHYERRLTQKDLIDFLPDMVRLQDEPIADPVCVPVYYISKFARENGVKVCQVGEGADELFCGYAQWLSFLKLERFNQVPGSLPFKKMAGVSARILGKTKGRPYELLRRSELGQPIFWGGAEAFTENQKNKLLSERMNNEFRKYTSWDAISPIHERFQNSEVEKHPLNWMTYLDLNLRLPELLLMRVDKMSMACGLEARVPFLDHKFVEYSMGIPPRLKYKNWRNKHILKEAVSNTIPRDIIERKKQGFGVPVHDWIVGDLGGYAKEEIMNFCQNTDYIDQKSVLDLFAKNDTALIWYLLNLSLWWKEYI
ncbi:MAG: asparagine synthase (glutamine-hydrolyzing) [Gammaproteobacteria bacterium]|nr:asparagine synthase (glutamine-hydrolyzing) [Gammaproteobacteria bacterium]